MRLWLNPVGGISGDMLLGALLGVGAPLSAVREAVLATGLGGWSLEVEPVRRAGLVATRALVHTDEAGSPERAAAELRDIVALARPEPVAALAGRALGALAEVESGLHGVPVDSVHLHELGGIDTVVDLVGCAAALHALGVTEVGCAALPMGEGTVRAAHGVLPLPAPATAALLARMGASVVPAGVAGETVTPTGAALLLACGARFGPVPAMAVRAVGYGAGGRDVPGLPNVVQALLGTPSPGPGGAGSRGRAAGEVRAMLQLETNVDDVTGELLGHLIGRLLAEGAADAWVTPTVMKKGRPAHTVHVLVAPDRAVACEQVLLRETGSLGLRRLWVERLALPRRTITVELGGLPVRVKSGPSGHKPEHDDVAAVAAALELPLREVVRRVQELLGDHGDLG